MVNFLVMIQEAGIMGVTLDTPIRPKGVYEEGWTKKPIYRQICLPGLFTALPLSVSY